MKNAMAMVIGSQSFIGEALPLVAKDEFGKLIKPILHNDYYYLVFKNSGTLEAKEETEVDYLLVGAGGGGGSSAGSTPRGGGGAGEFVCKRNKSIPKNIYNITVGSGGEAGTDGTDSLAFSDTARRGAKATSGVGTVTGVPVPGNNAYASGSGAANGTNQVYPLQSGGIGTLGAGNNGGTNFNDGLGVGGSWRSRCAGGGGGFSTAGGNGYMLDNLYYGGNGGYGVNLNDVIYWNDLTDSDIVALNIPKGYCGGGGGAALFQEICGVATHGGGSAAASIPASNGVENTGGGGGGKGNALNGGTGGKGGSGICIVRSLIPKNLKALIRLFWSIYNDPSAEEIELLQNIDAGMLLALLEAVYPEYMSLIVYEQYLDEEIETVEVEAETDDSLGAEILGYINRMEE